MQKQHDRTSTQFFYKSNDISVTSVDISGEETMRTIKIDTYKDWTITVTAEQNMCANFSFDITDPSGRTQHISMGGDNEQRALARAREMIDMEIALVAEE